MVNSIVFSAGCHAGYNIVNGHATDLDGAARLGAGVRPEAGDADPGTGYQYGDTEFLAHGERIYAEFARQLRVTTRRGVRSRSPSGARCSARSRSSSRQTPGLTALDEKSLLQTTLFGLPMLSVNLPQGRITETPSRSIIGATNPVGPGPGRPSGSGSEGDNLGADARRSRTKQLNGLGRSRAGARARTASRCGRHSRSSRSRA